MSREGISVDPSKISAMIGSPRPTSVTEIHSFFGLAGYYWRFIDEFSKIALPLKTRLTSAPMFTIQDGLGGFMVYNDVSLKELGRVLMQHAVVVTYASRQLKPYELNYLTYDLELAAI